MNGAEPTTSTYTYMIKRGNNMRTPITQALKKQFILIILRQDTLENKNKHGFIDTINKSILSCDYTLHILKDDENLNTIMYYYLTHPHVSYSTVIYEQHHINDLSTLLLTSSFLHTLFINLNYVNSTNATHASNTIVINEHIGLIIVKTILFLQTYALNTYFNSTNKIMQVKLIYDNVSAQNAATIQTIMSANNFDLPNLNITYVNLDKLTNSQQWSTDSFLVSIVSSTHIYSHLEKFTLSEHKLTMLFMSQPHQDHIDSKLFKSSFDKIFRGVDYSRFGENIFNTQGFPSVIPLTYELSNVILLLYYLSTYYKNSYKSYKPKILVELLKNKKALMHHEYDSADGYSFHRIGFLFDDIYASGNDIYYDSFEAEDM